MPNVNKNTTDDTSESNQSDQQASMGIIANKFLLFQLDNETAHKLCCIIENRKHHTFSQTLIELIIEEFGRIT